MTQQSQPRDIRRIWWEFAVEVTDELAVKAAEPGMTSDQQGDLEGVMGWSEDERLEALLTRIFISALNSVHDQVGVRPWAGAWVKVRKPEPDGSYAPFTLPGVPATGPEPTAGGFYAAPDGE